MIAAVRQKLKELGRADCESASLHGQESGKSVNLSSRGDAVKIKVDDCLIKAGKRCDCLYFYQPSTSKRYAILVELKGKHYRYALEQIEATIKHPTYTELLNAAQPNQKKAVVIVSKIANTNRPAKDEWEDETNYRLSVISRDENESVELVEEVIKKYRK